MKITKLKIHNVKSFKNKVEISFDEKFNVLIGPNGGGKSNLLDIITIVLRKFFLQGYKLSEGRDDGIPFRDIGTNDPFSQIEKFLEKFIGDTGESSIEVSFKITKGDISNIKAIKKFKVKFENNLKEFRNKPYSDFAFCDQWDLQKLKVGREVSYKITDNSFQDISNDSAEFYYHQYLKHLELFIILSETIENINIRPIYLYFSPNRGVSQNIIEANLSSESYYDLLIDYFSSTSRNQTSLLQIAANYFAAKRRKYEGDKRTGYEGKWNNDEEVKLVTKYLDRLRYSWHLQQIDDRKNIYKINLKKDGKNFTIDQASSGEKEIINFLLGIFAFNIKYGTIIIDEPELHLHPKWQTVLTDLFLELSKSNETDNQFILSTHSPVFISKNTVSKTTRIYKNNENTSDVVCLQEEELGSINDLLHIVNTHNNEKIFFADKVVLVEGIHDRIVYERLLQYYGKNSPEIIEVVEVHGKLNFDKYRKFLESFKIQNFVITDRDYLKQIGDSDIKKFFVGSSTKIDSILKDPKSTDRKTITEVMDKAISSSDLKNLRKIWKYIKSRQVSLKEALTDDEKQKIKNNIKKLENKNNILVLEEGEIEDYLPSSFKKLEKAPALIEESNFKKWIKNVEKTDLKNKMRFILRK